MSYGDDVRRAQLGAIVRDLAARDPFPRYPPGVPALCYFCGVGESREPDAPTVHAADCLWMRAVAVKDVTP